MEKINQKVEIFLRHSVNYQQDNWVEQSTATEFQYNNKRHAAIERIPFELNFGRHPQKGNLVAQMEFPRIEEFLTGLQRSQEEATKSMEEAQKNMKKQFNKKRRNPQGLKVGNNMWLESKNIHSN